MTADQLSRLLADRHAGEVFIPECKMGAAGSRSLDGWALLPTWSPLTTIGYEIKVTRSDWMRDQKFEEYRAVCHLFFIVAPKGVVASGELPPGVGLLEPIGKGDGMRLVQRVKPVRQEPEPKALTHLMAYALMWKRVGADPDETSRQRNARMFARWLNERQEFQVIGRSVSRRMREIVTAALDGRRLAEQRANGLAEASHILEELGITAGHDRWYLRRSIESALKIDNSLDTIRGALNALQRVDQMFLQGVDAERTRR